MGLVRYLFLIPVWISAIGSVGVPRFLSSALISSNLSIPRSSPLSAVSSLDLTEHPDTADELSDGFLSHLEEPTPENPDHSGECRPSIVPALLQITPSVHSQALVSPENTWACCPGALSPLSQDYYDKVLGGCVCQWVCQGVLFRFICFYPILVFFWAGKVCSGAPGCSGTLGWVFSDSFRYGFDSRSGS